MADKKFLDLNGLGYAIRKMDAKKANLESPVFTGTPTTPTALAGTKNTQIANTKFVNDNFVSVTGDTMTGPLKFNTQSLPIIDLHMSKSGSNVFTLTTNGSIFVGDGSSTDGARVYYCRKVATLDQAILTGVSVGYNPKDQAHYSTSKDYGIKFDVNVAQTLPQPASLRQCASFFVGVNGAVVGYSGSTNTPLSANKIYTVLDSNNIKDDEYIRSLEQRISDLENQISELNNANNANNV